MDISTQADIYEKKGTVLRETCIKVIVTKKQTKKNRINYHLVVQIHVKHLPISSCFLVKISI